MKKTLLIAAMFLSIYGFGQKLSEKVPGLNIINNDISSENDTIIKVVYKRKMENKKIPVFLINGKFVNESILKWINPNQIANIKVEKENFKIDNVEYFGKILIETKDSYKPKFISLNNLKLKHTNIRENSTIFQIDEEIINADYDKYVVDENYILSIVVEKFEKEKLNINFIKVTTKSEENIKKSKEKRIRGNDEFAFNN